MSGVSRGDFNRSAPSSRSYSTQGASSSDGRTEGQQRITRIAQEVLDRAQKERNALPKPIAASDRTSFSRAENTLEYRTTKLFLEKGLNQFQMKGNTACTVICFEFLQFALVSGKDSHVLKQVLDGIIRSGVSNFNELVKTIQDQNKKTEIEKKGFSSQEIIENHKTSFPRLEEDVQWIEEMQKAQLNQQSPMELLTPGKISQRDNQFLDILGFLLRRDQAGKDKDTGIVVTCRGYTYAILRSFKNNQILLFDSHGERQNEPAYILSFKTMNDLAEWLKKRFPYQEGSKANNDISFSVFTKKARQQGPSSST